MILRIVPTGFAKPPKSKCQFSDLKKAIIALVPSNPKLGVNPEQAAKRYTTKLQNLNPKNNIWHAIIRSIETGRSLEDYRKLYREMKQSADVLFLNLSSSTMHLPVESRLIKENSSRSNRGSSSKLNGWKQLELRLVRPRDVLVVRAAE